MTQIQKSIHEKMVTLADIAKENAYSPYSGYKVGAVLLAVQNGVVTIELGANVENSAYGPTNCAERTAIFAAAARGIKPNEIASIAVAASGENFSPCGVCRQVISEFEIPFTVYEFDGVLKSVTLDELLPDRFTLKEGSETNEELFFEIATEETLKLVEDKIQELS